MLRLENVCSGYGQIQVLHDVSMEVNEGEIICLLGANAAGKTTTMKTILGSVRARSGAIHFGTQRIDGMPTNEIVRLGISPVPEGRQVFARMTVLDNLEVGSFARPDRTGFDKDIARVFQMFPVLAERARQLAGTLSGGEQQMLAIGRALMARPKLICMDEPSMGLAPIVVERVYDVIVELAKGGSTILLIEQNAHLALSVASRGYVLEHGHIVLQDSAEGLLHNEMVLKAYLGEGTPQETVH